MLKEKQNRNKMQTLVCHSLAFCKHPVESTKMFVSTSIKNCNWSYWNLNKANKVSYYRSYEQSGLVCQNVWYPFEMLVHIILIELVFIKVHELYSLLKWIHAYAKVYDFIHFSYVFLALNIRKSLSDTSLSIWCVYKCCLNEPRSVHSPKGLRNSM